MKFTIRDLLWLTVGVALVVAWRIDCSQLAKRYHRMAFDIAISGAKLRAVGYQHKQQRFWQ